jgi:hypothetical protein
MLGTIEPLAERDLRELSGVSLQGCQLVDQRIDIVAGLTQATTEQFRRSRRGGGCLT